jgi:hypothetical protein
MEISVTAPADRDRASDPLTRLKASKTAEEVTRVQDRLSLETLSKVSKIVEATMIAEM